MSYKLKFIESARSMASSLSYLVNNLAEGIHKIKCKYEDDNKKCETYRIKLKDLRVIFEICVLEYKRLILLVFLLHQN